MGRIQLHIETLHSDVNILLSMYRKVVHASITDKEDQGFSSVVNHRQ